MLIMKRLSMTYYYRLKFLFLVVLWFMRDRFTVKGSVTPDIYSIYI